MFIATKMPKYHEEKTVSKLNRINGMQRYIEGMIKPQKCGAPSLLCIFPIKIASARCHFGVVEKERRGCRLENK